jgi:hypothetical protein
LGDLAVAADDCYALSTHTSVDVCTARAIPRLRVASECEPGSGDEGVETEVEGERWSCSRAFPQWRDVGPLHGN